MVVKEIEGEILIPATLVVHSFAGSTSIANTC